MKGTIKLISYPARPTNGGSLEYAAPKNGLWMWEPKINGHRVMLHLPTLTMFNRQGEVYSHSDRFTLAAAKAAGLFKDHTWLDCEALGLRGALGNNSLVVLDLPVRYVSQGERKGALSWMMEGRELPRPAEFRPELEPESVYSLHHLVTHPALLLTHTLEAWWEQMQEFNRVNNMEFFEGFVAKAVNVEYPMQLESPTKEFPLWVKHRFN